MSVAWHVSPSVTCSSMSTIAGPTNSTVGVAVASLVMVTPGLVVLHRYDSVGVPEEAVPSRLNETEDPV